MFGTERFLSGFESGNLAASISTVRFKVKFQQGSAYQRQKKMHAINYDNPIPSLHTYQGEYHGESEEGPLLGLPEAHPADVPVGRLHVRVGERRVVRAPRGPVAGPGQLQLSGIQLQGEGLA